MHIIRDNCSSGKGGGGRKSGSKPSPKQTLPRVRKRAGSSLPPPTHIVTHAPAPILPHMPVPYTCKRSNPRRGSTTMLGADTPCAYTGAGRPTPQPAAQLTPRRTSRRPPTSPHMPQRLPAHTNLCHTPASARIHAGAARGCSGLTHHVLTQVRAGPPPAGRPTHPCHTARHPPTSPHVSQRLPAHSHLCHTPASP